MKPQTKLAPTLDIREGEHLIGAFSGKPNGPTVIAVGGLHGNEPGGVKALMCVADELTQMQDKLLGRVYLLAGNTRALANTVRFSDRDLNRAWTRENRARMGTASFINIPEGREMTELDNLFDGILITAKDEVYVLDLHSTSAGGSPFATVGDTLRNREFAGRFPVKTLLGIEEQLDGTMLEYLNNIGVVTLGFEGGQHQSDETVANHTALVWLALVNSGILAAADVPDLEVHRKRLAEGRRGAKIVEVRYREVITPDDGFVMNPGFSNFDPVTKGQTVAKNARGPITVDETGLLLMPLYQKLGEDGFFLGRTVAPFWLWLSKILRTVKIQDYVYWLPGVERDEHEHETLVVNTRVARIFPLQIFHLLGFRRRRWSGDKLIVSRRRHDTESPFTG